MIPYNPQLNPIEQYFNQIKHYLRLNKKVLKYDELVVEIRNAIKQVKKENYKNYFENAYNKDAYKDYVKKDSTLKRKLKNYSPLGRIRRIAAIKIKLYKNFII